MNSTKTKNTHSEDEDCGILFKNFQRNKNENVLFVAKVM